MPLLICFILNSLIVYECRPLVRPAPQRVFWLPLGMLLFCLDLLSVGPITLAPTLLIAWFFSLTGYFLLLITTTYALATHWLLHRPQPSRADYLVVLGAQVTSTGITPVLARRLQTALAYYQRQPFAPKLLLSGGQGINEPLSEAAAMAKVALTHHISQQQIILEDHSTSTRENLNHARSLIQADWQGPHPPVIIVVTSDYHLLRSLYWAKRAGISVKLLGATTTVTSLFHALSRELLALTWQLRVINFSIWSIMLLITWVVMN